MNTGDSTIVLTPLQKVRGLPLSWVQPSGWKNRYELRAGEDALIAVMQQDGALKSSVTVYTAEGTWHLRRRGFFRMFTEIWQEGAAEPVLSVRSRWNGGTLTLPGGRALKWRTTNFWGTHWAFEDEATGQILLEYQYGGTFKYRADLTLFAGAEELSCLMPLIVLGWYLILLHIGDTTAAAVVVATAH
jgi:hypothetical protein